MIYKKNNIRRLGKTRQSGAHRQLLMNRYIKTMQMRAYYLNQFINYKKNEILRVKESLNEKQWNEIDDITKQNGDLLDNINHNELENIDLEDIDENDEDRSTKYFAQWYTNVILKQIKDEKDKKERIEKEKSMEEQRKNKIILNSSQDRILVIISCHTENQMRFTAILLIMKYLAEIDNIDIVIVNTKKTALSGMVKNIFKSKYLNYYEIDNDQYYGFSKWYFGLISTNYKKYKFVTFINDSILIHNSIKHFFDYTRFKDVDLYGFNDSTQIKPHYQSYIFSVKTSSIHNFIRMFHENKSKVHSYMDAVYFYELQLFNYFENRDCFLKIGNFPSQVGKNIFFNNDFLYVKLRDSGLFPFTKLKRIS